MNDESVASNKNGRRSVLNSRRPPPPIGVEMNEMHGGRVTIFSIQLINWTNLGFYQFAERKRSLEGKVRYEDGDWRESRHV